jgi:hypothetical protein
MAITWRTLNQPTLAGVGVLMNGAQQGLNNGFQAIQNVLAQRNKTDAANWQQEKSNNTADYLDAVQGIKDPAQLQDPATQENLAALRQQFGYKIDANAVRGADEKRATDLQVQATNNMKFSDLNQEHDQRPLVEEFYRLKNAGDFKGAQGLLDANGFLNEGALADSLKSGQYAASGEQRAVAQDGRSAAAFSLNQKVGLANLNWTNEQRAELKDKQSRAKAGDVLLGDTISQFTASRQDAAAKTNALAESLGVKVVDGVPDLTNVPEDVKAKLSQGIQEQGLDMIESPTAARNRLIKDLRASGYPETEIADRVKSFEGAVNTNNTLSAGDQTELDAQKSAITSAVTTATEQEKKNFADLTKKNIYLQGVEDPNMTVEDMTKSLKGNGFDPLLWEGWNREQAITDTTKLMTEGITVDGTHYDVPPAILKAGIAMGADDWFDPRQGIIDSVETLIKSNPKAYADSIGALEAHKKELQAINEAGIKQASRVDTESKARNYIPYDVNKFSKALQERK